MNTRKQVLIMSVLLMMMLVVIAVYAAWYPYRADSAEVHFEEAVAERGAILFARNCRLCHGDVGEGGVLGGRLPGAPALNRPDLQGFEDSGATLQNELGLAHSVFDVSEEDAIDVDDIILIGEERMKVVAVDGTTVRVERAHAHTHASGHFPGASIWVFSDALLAEQVTMITNTLMCGRVGTAMPLWAQSQGGPLGDEQLRQLTVLITTARWERAAEEADIEDVIASALTTAVPSDATQISVTDITRFEVDEAIRIGGERLRVTGVPDFPDGATGIPGDLTVERAIYGTFAGNHPVETSVLRFPETPEPQILEQACGQRAMAPAPAGPCEVRDGVVHIGADNIVFDCSQITVPSGGETTVEFVNHEAVPHNVAFYMSEEDPTPVADGAVGPVITGPEVTDTMTFETPPPGEYFFRCDVHPVTMVGTFTVED